MYRSNVRTRRIFTLAFAAVMFGGCLTQMSATAGCSNSFSCYGEIIGRLLSVTGMVTHANISPATDGDALASIETWDGNGTNNSWTTNDNWAGIGGAGAGDDLVFPQTAARKINDNDFPVNTSFNKLIFNGTNYDITGNQIFLNESLSCEIPNNGGDSPIFHPNIILGADNTWTSGSVAFRPCIVAGVVNLNGHRLLLQGFGHHVLSGFINGTGTLLKIGGGTAIISGNSSNFGTTTIQRDGASVSGGIQVNGSLGNILLSSGPIFGTGTVGAIDANLPTGPNDGVVAPGNSNAPGILTTTGPTDFAPTSTFEVNINGTTVDSQYDRLNVTGGSSILLNGANLDIDLGFTPTPGQQFTIMQIIGAGSRTGQFAQGSSIVAGGQLFSITYTSTSVVLTSQGSSLAWDGGGADNNWSTASNWSPNFAPQDGLDLVFPDSAPGDSRTNNNDMVGLDVGSMAINGQAYSLGGNGITLSNGLTSGATVGTSSTINLGITLTTQAQTFNNSGASVIHVSVLNLNGFGLAVDGTNLINIGTIAGAGGIAKSGTGTLSLNGNNTYSGLTTVTNGLLRVGSTNALGATGEGNRTIVLEGGSLQMSSSNNVPEAINISGNGFGGTGAMQTAGCSAGCSVSGPITIAGLTTISTTIGSDILTLTGVIGSTGGSQLTKGGQGKLVMTAANTYTGTTNVGAGVLLVNGNNANSSVNLAGGTLGGVGTVNGIFASGGTVAPGASPGLLKSSNALTLSGATALDIEIGGPADSQYDRLSYTTSGNLGGATLTGSLINGFDPAPGQQFTIVSTVIGSLTGQFAQGSSVVIGGRTFDITYNSQSVVLTAMDTIAITGNIMYAIVSKPVPQVAINAPGSIPVSGSTDSAGEYVLTGFGSGAYTVTPSKATQLCTTSNGIFANDASLVSQHIVGLTTLSPAQLAAAKVSGNSTLTSFDAGLIAQKVVGICNAPNLAGQWRFTPPFVDHPSGVTTNLIENYTAYMMGDVSGDWDPTAPVHRTLPASTESKTAIRGSMPKMAAAPSSEVVVPFRIDNLAGRSVSSYQFDVEYDPAVLTVSEIAASVANTMGESLSVVSNSTIPGLLKVAVYGAIPVTGDGVYADLRFTVTGGIGTVTPLKIIDLRFNDGIDEIAAVEGRVAVTDVSGESILTGRLITATGDAVVHAEVTLLNTKNAKRFVVSDQYGRFAFSGLTVGETYTLHVNSTLFTFSPVTVSAVDQIISLDLIADL